MNWLLPAHLADLLPAEAARVEALRRRLLDLFRVHGFELVTPPTAEYLESLLTGAGEALQLRTFKLVDQLSGRTLGVRADMTAQAARIDAHLLNRQGVARLCYCGSVLHAQPASLMSSRELTQLGAELYGYAGPEADLEILGLLAATLAASGLASYQVELSHIGLCRALARAAQVDAETEARLFSLLQAKDESGLAAVCADLPAPYAAAFCALPRLYGGAETIARARLMLPPLPEIASALDALARLVEALPELAFAIDLSDLRGYHYHNGVVFTVYAPGSATYIAQGGRYDGVGKSFGRDRPATGFSLDLRELARLLPATSAPGAIRVPYHADLAVAARRELQARIAALRSAGEIVIEALPGEAADEGPAIDRELIHVGGEWTLRFL